MLSRPALLRLACWTTLGVIFGAVVWHWIAPLAWGSADGDAKTPQHLRVDAGLETGNFQSPNAKTFPSELFEAITDRTTALSAEELPAYWELLRHVEQLPVVDLPNATTISPNFDAMTHSPAECRGKPVHKVLNIRRVLAYDLPASPLQTHRLYEVWGYVAGVPDELYVVVTADLPEGMQVGASVVERAAFSGYFFKLQGYLAAGAETRLAPLAAPLLIGHLANHALPEMQFAQGNDWWRLVAGVAIAGSFAASLTRRTRRRIKPKSSDDVDGGKSAAGFEAWLENSLRDGRA